MDVCSYECGCAFVLVLHCDVQCCLVFSSSALPIVMGVVGLCSVVLCCIDLCCRVIIADVLACMYVS